ncbi:PPOX class F420-dependent oxidoreductase [Streptosporangium sp. NPDC050280]|uniref:PPOX class F420-dependent oxidoreductase n=1 Tax=unclassified Streptosporangium TaxID=2632669 RepID=UPI00342C62B5
MTRIQDLGTEKYVSVTTFKKSGAAVPTPVWAASDGDSLLIWTAGSSGKAKRIRNNPEVVVAACDVRGNTRGEGIRGVARELPAEERERVRGLIIAKYGFLARLIMIGSRFRRGADGTVGIRISPPS